MAKALKLACSITSKLITGSSSKFMTLPKLASTTMKQRCYNLSCGFSTSSRAHTSMLASVITRPLTHRKRCQCLACTSTTVKYSTEVEKELSSFLEKEIKFEKSRSSDKLQKIPGFEITTDGGDVTLTKTSDNEKIVVKLSVNGAVDSLDSGDGPGKEDEPPQMACRPPFHVEITKDGNVLAFQCSFPSPYPDFDEEGNPTKGKPEGEEIDDQFEVQEITVHGGEWKETTYSVSAESLDADLFDLLMDMLDERGINDEFVAQLIDFCTAYENQQYVNFLQNLQKFAEK